MFSVASSRWRIALVVFAITGCGLLVLVRGSVFFFASYILVLSPCLPVFFRLVKVGWSSAGWSGGGGSVGGYHPLDIRTGCYRFASAEVKVHLNPAERQVQGFVRAGTFAGKGIHQLNAYELQALKASPSLSVLTHTLLTFLEGKGVEGQGFPQPDVHTAMTLLGVESLNDRQAIRLSYRRLMSAFHSDRGGSPELAALLGSAKSVLLKK